MREAPSAYIFEVRRQRPPPAQYLKTNLVPSAGAETDRAALPPLSPSLRFACFFEEHNYEKNTAYHDGRLAVIALVSASTVDERANQKTDHHDAGCTVGPGRH